MHMHRACLHRSGAAARAGRASGTDADAGVDADADANADRMAWELGPPAVHPASRCAHPRANATRPGHQARHLRCCRTAEKSTSPPERLGPTLVLSTRLFVVADNHAPGGRLRNVPRRLRHAPGKAPPPPGQGAALAPPVLFFGAAAADILEGLAEVEPRGTTYDHQGVFRSEWVPGPGNHLKPPVRSYERKLCAIASLVDDGSNHHRPYRLATKIEAPGTGEWRTGSVESKGSRVDNTTCPSLQYPGLVLSGLPTRSAHAASCGVWPTQGHLASNQATPRLVDIIGP
ncbi:hypothetical protein PCL_03058 [Purpureocillium lilacinum]|uniref:Uncharacterized protein n=1 Tax=Purpureocillium lilacinum TaxID=33203 RepID=A0A2U3DYF1_PURLI|nr:hypothetical protein Purlil1_497 [Purpureocillium lilacinum]PWI67290.1 hypothetical protein PCL_03058 [Purpureocillium lilacinum]